jgi:osmotically-inducible protein OsmY
MNTQQRNPQYRQGYRQDPYGQQRIDADRDRWYENERYRSSPTMMDDEPRNWQDRDLYEAGGSVQRGPRDYEQNPQRYGSYRDTPRWDEEDTEWRMGDSSRQRYDDRAYRSSGYGNGVQYRGNGQWNDRQGSDRSEQPRNSLGQFTSERRGMHAGRGPKGYRRSDERITEDVNEALSQHPDLDASEIEVKVQNGEVTLSGTVEERQYKRMAEDVVERCSGVQDVRNEIRVQGSESSSRRENESTSSSSTHGKERQTTKH